MKGLVVAKLAVRVGWKSRVEPLEVPVELLIAVEELRKEEVVGASGFEPPTSWSRTVCSSFRGDSVKFTNWFEHIGF
jgi:hypothetical protein